MLVYRLWYRRELPFTIHDAVAATIPIHGFHAEGGHVPHTSKTMRNRILW